MSSAASAKPDQVTLDALANLYARPASMNPGATSSAFGFVVAWSSAFSHQIDDREQRHPDDVERVPEQVEAEQPAQNVGAEALDEDLRHHRAQPQEPGADMQAVAADHGEEGRQEGAALRARACADQAGEIVRLQQQEARPSRPVTSSDTWVHS